MKKRVFMGMDNSVYNVVISTEDWSQDDLKLMYEFGEPEINVGGDVYYPPEWYDDNGSSGDAPKKSFGDEFVRILHGFPYSRGFDSRNYKSVKEAVSVGKAWKDLVLARIDDAIVALRQNAAPLPTEEVSEI